MTHTHTGTSSWDYRQPATPDDLELRLAKLADAGPAAIDARLAELDREWSAGRATKIALAVVTLAGVGLTAAFGWWWAVLPAVAGLFLLEYVFSRHSTLVSVFRGAGLRAGNEIEREKLALRALRGDFRNLPTVHEIVDRDSISRLEGEGGIVPDEDTGPDAREAAKSVVSVTHS